MVKNSYPHGNDPAHLEESLSGLWILKRQDDNGNQCILATFDSKRKAESEMVCYEQKGHKQTYWVEKDAA